MSVGAALLLLWGTASARPPCGFDPALLSPAPASLHAPPSRPAPASLPGAARGAAPPPAGGLALRDAYGDFPHVWLGEHVALKAGPDDPPDDAEAARIVAALDAAWAEEIDRLGWPAPVGSEQWYLNVYVGDTGAPAPPGLGAAGYYRHDPEGLPVLVLARATVGATLEAPVLAHELLHALQDAAGAWPADEHTWWWEASAMWVEGEVLDDHPDHYAYLFGFALQPERPLWSFAPFEDGSLDEYHAYGAMILARWISEIGADASLIRDSFTAPGDAATPEAALWAALAARGVEDPLLELCGHDAAWDYALGEAYAASVEDWSFVYASEGAEVVATVAGQTEGLVDAPAATWPGPLGCNTVRWRFSGEGSRALRVELDPVGSAGRLASARAALVVRGDAGVWREPLPLGEEHTVELGAGDREAWLVLALTPEDAPAVRGDPEERWAWRYAVGPRVAAEDTGPDLPWGESGGEPPPGCGCAGVPAREGGRGGAAWAWGALGGALLVALTRKRRTAPAAR